MFSKQERNRSVADSVFDEIWASIIQGQIEYGSQITEEGLADKFQVSRTPLREALQKLIMLGLVVRLPNRTLQVMQMNVKSMENLSITREYLEALIAHNVWQRKQNNEIDLEPLKQLNERMRKLIELDDMDLLLETGLDFHKELRNLSDNELAVNLLENILLALEPYRQFVKSHSERSIEIVNEHAELLELLEGQNSDAVEKAMHKHIRQARDFYRASMDKL